MRWNELSRFAVATTASVSTVNAPGFYMFVLAVFERRPDKPHLGMIYTHTLAPIAIGCPLA